MKAHRFPILSPLISALLLSALFLLPAAPSLAATEVIQNGTYEGAIRVAVQDQGAMGVWRCNAASCGVIGDATSWVRQIYGDYSKASFVFLNGNRDTTMRFSSNSSGSFTTSANIWTGVSNTSNGDNSITTTYMADNNNARITQTTSIKPGDNYYKMRWDIENIGQTTYNDLFFTHGEDTYLAGIDRGEGHFDNTQQMAYVTNIAAGIADMMGIYADPASPFASYYQGYYYTGFTQMHSGKLGNTFDNTNTDAGYALGWERDSLAPGETWTIIAYEKFMRSRGVLVMAPAEQTGGPGGTVSYPFIVQNLDMAAENISLSAASGSGWTVSVQDAAGNPIPSINIPGGGQATVYVNVSIPSTAAAGDTDQVTLTGTAGVNSGSDSTTTTASAADPGSGHGNFTSHDGFRGNGGLCGVVVGSGEEKAPGPVTGAKLTVIYFAILLAPVALLQWRRRLAGKRNRADKPCPDGEAGSSQDGPSSPKET